MQIMQINSFDKCNKPCFTSNQEKNPATEKTMDKAKETATDNDGIKDKDTYMHTGGQAISAEKLNSKDEKIKNTEKTKLTQGFGDKMTTSLLLVLGISAIGSIVSAVKNKGKSSKFAAVSSIVSATGLGGCMAYINKGYFGRAKEYVANLFNGSKNDKIQPEIAKTEDIKPEVADAEATKTQQ